jgi:hypothetical protein
MTSKSHARYTLTPRANRIVTDWKALEQRARTVHGQLGETKIAFYEMIYVQILLQTNLNELYIAGESFYAVIG